MRYAVLLLFGSFGALLLVLGWHKYTQGTARFAEGRAAEAVVQSITPEGALALTYQVDGKSHDLLHEPLLGFPRASPGDKFDAIYNPAEPTEARLRHWTTAMTADVLVCAGFGCVGLFLGIGGFFAMGTWPTAASYRPVEQVTNLNSPIVLHHPSGNFYFTLFLAALCFAAAVFLIRDPDILWTRWLAWPAAAVACLFGAVGIYHAFDKKNETIRADDRGITIRSRSDTREFSWSAVRALKYVTETKREYSSTLKRSSTRTVARYLLLLDGSGNTLLRLDEDMQPVEDYRRLKAYIPGRTGLTVENETRDVLL